MIEEDPISDSNVQSEMAEEIIGIQEDQQQVFPERAILNEQYICIKEDRLKEPLHRSIGALTSQNNNGFGSGILISENLILTCAHNLVNRYDTKQEFKNLRFYLGAIGASGVVDQERYHQIEGRIICPEFRKLSTTVKYDYAVVKLKNPVKLDKYLPLSIPCHGCLNDNKQISLSIFGYPKQYNNYLPIGAKKMRLYQYGTSGLNRIVDVKPAVSQLRYTNRTFDGHSGCPVIVNNNIIGIHIGHGKGQFNIGRLLDEKLIKNIKKWCLELKAQPFQQCQYSCPSIVHNVKMTLNEFNQKAIDLSDNGLKQINLNNFIQVQSLNLSCNNIRSIMLHDYRKLKQIWLHDNQMVEIDLQHNTLLERLWLNNNQLRNVSLVNNELLHFLDLQFNYLGLIQLAISKDVKEERYKSYFSLFNQQSQICEIKITCKDILLLEKADEIKKNWQKIQFDPQQNRTQCQYNYKEN